MRTVLVPRRMRMASQSGAGASSNEIVGAPARGRPKSLYWVDGWSVHPFCRVAVLVEVNRPATAKWPASASDPKRTWLRSLVMRARGSTWLESAFASSHR